MLRDRPENPLDVRTPSTNITVPHTVGKSLVSVSMKKDLRSGPDKQVCEMGSIYMVPRTNSSHTGTVSPYVAMPLSDYAACYVYKNGVSS